MCVCVHVCTQCMFVCVYALLEYNSIYRVMYVQVLYIPAYYYGVDFAKV